MVYHKFSTVNLPCYSLTSPQQMSFCWKSLYKKQKVWLPSVQFLLSFFIMKSEKSSEDIICVFFETPEAGRKCLKCIISDHKSCVLCESYFYHTLFTSLQNKPRQIFKIQAIQLISCHYFERTLFR